MTPSPTRASTDVITALLWAAANLLFARLLGSWLIVTGTVGIGLAGIVILLALAPGRTAARRVAADALLVLTLINFNGWAFSHLANLMFFLGLFFFALFGLISGAALFRLLGRYRPLPSGLLLAAGGVVVLGSWVGGLALEAGYLSGDALDFCMGKGRIRLTAELSAEELRTVVPRQIQQHLRAVHSQTTMAYVWWSLRSGRMDLHIPGRQGPPLVYERPQRRIGFGLRLGLSLLLLAYGVFCQIRWLDRTAQAERDFKIARSRERGDDDEPAPAPSQPHSHSMVAGGFEEIS